MAATEKKIADLVAFTTPADGDLLPVVDVSDTAQSDDGSTKKITRANFLGTLFSIAADTGTDLAILPSETFSILGGTGIDSVASATRKITLNIDATVATLTGTQILTNKTLTTPQINDISADHQYIFSPSELTADRNVVLPILTGNDEFVFKDHIQTLVGKTLTSPVLVTPKADTLDESTGDAGVTVEGVLMKDSEINVDTIDEKTAAAGVTIESVLLKDGNIDLDAGNLAGSLATIDDDGVTSFTPGKAIGIILVYGRATGYKANYGIISYRTSATHYTQLMVTGTDIEVATGALTGTTGTDAKFTVSADSATAKIYIENRLGAARSFGYVLFGM